MLGVPTMLVAMMEHPSFAAADLSSLKAIYSGGSTVPAAIVADLERRLGAPFTIVFGQTECSPVALMTWATDTITDKANTIGTPMPNVEVKIVNPDTGQTVPVGEIGEICTRGYHVMHGYFEDASRHQGCRSMPRAGCTPAISERWMQGATARSREDSKDMIIRGGENIYPRELGGVAVPPSQDRRRRRRRIAGSEMGRSGIGVHSAGAGHDHRQGRAARLHARASRTARQTPRHWFVVDAMPLTGSGKIRSSNCASNGPKAR